MAYKEYKTKVFDCICERCNYNWTTFKLPNACSRCKTSLWNKKKRESKIKPIIKSDIDLDSEDE